MAKLPQALGARAATVLFSVVGSVILFHSCTEYVAPFEAGVRESRFGGGVAAEVLRGGQWYFTGPGVTIHRFPEAVQSLEMSASDAEITTNYEDVRRVPPIEVDTSDGSKVKVDVSILYRIFDPYAVMTKIGPRRLFEDSAVIPKAVLALKKNLGKLLAEDFYHESKRVSRCVEARDELNTLLKDVGISVDYVLVRQYSYERGYQAQIEERKVKDQLVFTNRSIGEAAKEEAAQKKIEAEGAANVAIEVQRGEAEVTKIRAEADLYRVKKTSEADMLVKVAEANGTQLVNQAYSQAGSDNLVALEMAKVLDGLQYIVLSDPKNGMNPLNVDEVVKMLGAK